MQLLYLLDNEFSDLKTKIAALFSLGRDVFFNDQRPQSDKKKIRSFQNVKCMLFNII